MQSAAEPLIQPAEKAAEWWRGAVVYHVYPLSFADADGDGTGDLAGVCDKLDYIASLGVDMVWISPFYRSPMRDFGYDVADYCDVDPLFGSLADFDALVAKAHRLGLKVVIDLVFSHTSDEHDWFKQSRQSRDNSKADWYVWADAKPDGGPPNNWQAVFGGPCWTWDARRQQYYLHNFLPAQPNLNVHHPAVQEALLEAMRFWLDRSVDGFRMDAVNFMMHDPALTDNPPVTTPGKRTRPFDFQHHFFNQSHPAIPQFLSRLRRLAESYGDRFLVAEVGGERADEEMKLYTAGEDRLQSAYSFHYLYADELTPQLVRRGMEDWPEDEKGAGWPSWAFSNHDAPRSVSRWAKGRDRKAFAEMGLFLLMSLRGNAFLYQGEELGLPQAHVPFDRMRDPEAIMNWPLTLGRDGARTPMPWRAAAGSCEGPEPWLPMDPAHLALAVDLQEADPGSTLQAARRALHWRRTLTGLRTGGVRFLDAPAGVLAFERGRGSEAVLCVFNLGSAPAAFRIPPGWRIIERVNAPGVEQGLLAPLAAIFAVR
jgi:alpha-glucosidase